MRRESKRVSTGLGPLESRIMELLWSQAEATVGSVAEGLAVPKRPAYTTVMTVMGRLTAKGLLRRRLDGRAYVYRPAMTKAEFLADRSRAGVQALVRDFGEVALAHFVEEIEGADPKKLEQLREFLKPVERK